MLSSALPPLRNGSGEARAQASESTSPRSIFRTSERHHMHAPPHAAPGISASAQQRAARVPQAALLNALTWREWRGASALLLHTFEQGVQNASMCNFPKASCHLL